MHEGLPELSMPTEEQVHLAAEGFRMLADPTRIKLLWALLQGESSVTCLAELVRAGPTTVSQHLAKLRLAGLVYGIWAPAATPPEIVSKLARDISNALATPELLEWLNRHDADPMRMTRAEFAGFVESESERAALLLSSGGTPRQAPPQPGP